MKSRTLCRNSGAQVLCKHVMAGVVMAHKTTIECWLCQCDVLAQPRKVVFIIGNDNLPLQVDLSCLSCYEKTKDGSRSFNGLPCVVALAPVEVHQSSSQKNVHS